jgi:Putative Sin3 binding protein
MADAAGPVTISSLAAALARSSSLDIAKSRDAGHLDTRSLPSKRGGLPTPPNSLSPTLPPNKANSPPFISLNLPLQPIDTEIDLRDSSTHNLPSRQASSLSPHALAGHDATGAITPALLAKHHLPEVLLNNGPLAIRVVLAQLTQTVPGFARIPPAKARRMVVAALESRSGGGLKGDIVFDKIGWGRWDARYRHQQPKERPSTSLPEAQDGLSRAALLSRSWALQAGRSRPSSPPRDSVSEEADKMSLEGATRPQHAPASPLDEDCMTDEEDWESIGPGALRAPSYAASHMSRRDSHASSLGRPSKPAPIPQKSGAAAQPRASSLSAFCQNAHGISYSAGIMPFHYVYSSSLSSSRMQGVPDYGSPQEREAVEALLRMGSM